jgi:hypothetical protein
MVGRAYFFLFQPHLRFIWLHPLPARVRTWEIAHLLALFHSTYPLLHLVPIFSFLSFVLRSYPVHITDFRPVHITDFLPSHLIFFLIFAFIVSTPFIAFRLYNFPASAPLRSSFVDSSRPRRFQSFRSCGGSIHLHHLHHLRLRPIERISGHPT